MKRKQEDGRQFQLMAHHTPATNLSSHPAVFFYSNIANHKGVRMVYTEFLVETQCHTNDYDFRALD